MDSISLENQFKILGIQLEVQKHLVFTLVTNINKNATLKIKDIIFQ